MNKNWYFTSATNFCLKITDGTHDTPKKVKQGKYLVTSKHIKDNKIDFDSAYFISIKDFHEINKRSKVDQWDVLISMIGTCGICFIESNDDVNYAAKNVGIFKTGNEINARWLYYYLNSPIGVSYLNAAKSGSIQSYIPLCSLRELPILLPNNKNYKEKIINIMHAIDYKIELNNRINADLEAMAKQLYDYWFVQFDFPDANGKPYKSSGGKMVFNKTLNREIPEGWGDKTLSEIANITMGQSPKGSSYNEEQCGTIFFQGATNFGWLFPTKSQYTTMPKKMAKKNDILLSVRAPVGAINIAEEDCCIGRGLAAINSKNGYDGFLFYIMKYFKQIFDRRNLEGTTFGSITKDGLHDLILAYPDDKTVKKYNNAISNNNKMIFKNNKQNQTLKTLRDWLLPMLMNGQVKVK